MRLLQRFEVSDGAFLSFNHRSECSSARRAASRSHGAALEIRLGCLASPCSLPAQPGSPCCLGSVGAANRARGTGSLPPAFSGWAAISGVTGALAITSAPEQEDIPLHTVLVLALLASPDRSIPAPTGA